MSQTSQANWMYKIFLVILLLITLKTNQLYRENQLFLPVCDSWQRRETDFHSVAGKQENAVSIAAWFHSHVEWMMPIQVSVLLQNKYKKRVM